MGSFIIYNSYLDRQREQATEQKTSKKTSKKTDKKTSKKTDEKILTMIQSMPDATVAELANATGLSISGVRWNLNKLREEKRIQRVGPDKGGHWEVLS